MITSPSEISGNEFAHFIQHLDGNYFKHDMQRLRLQAFVKLECDGPQGRGLDDANLEITLSSRCFDEDKLRNVDL